jgi:FAD/FMN-containing dehydrogenase
MGDAADGARTAGRTTADLAATLTQVLGPEAVSTDLETRRLHSQDIWSVSPETVDLVAAPRTVEELSRAVAAAAEAGFAIAPRGAGMSYTNAYIPAGPRTVSLDLSRMNRVLAIDPADMTVTVQAGCTWAALNAALEPLGLRTPFWGPMSGLTSTIGGGLSQLNAMFGAGRYGTSSESVVALVVVLANGEILRTGARGPGGEKPFYRHYGPDLAGLFCGDAGVLAVKAEITLRLMRRPAHEGFASFAFPTGEALLSAMAELSRAGLASEMCAFDPGLTKVRLKRASLASDVKVLGSVVAHETSLAKGLMAAARIAMGGRNFVEGDEYSVHVIFEGRSRTGVDEDVEAARRIARGLGGREIENTIGKVIRATPFPPLNSMVGPEGERWAPVHGVVSLSDAPRLFAAMQALFAERAAEFERLGVYTGYLFTSLSTNALIIEPVFYWPDSRQALIDASVEPAHLARLPTPAPNPEATRAVAAARRRIIEICTEFGCGHFQIGRSYDYVASRDRPSRRLLAAVKAALDPLGVLNPGGLGLRATTADDRNAALAVWAPPRRAIGPSQARPRVASAFRTWRAPRGRRTAFRPRIAPSRATGQEAARQ